ncbi:hypothetical protein C8J57DRAFT_1326995 [Mycena rebaudengoi]|nr:hypothetical protein C8J57DRAFT_1326995 [Mycena rebaudengoi]
MLTVWKLSAQLMGDVVGSRSSKDFTIHSTLQCSKCKNDVKVGLGGYANLDSHLDSKKCRAQQEVNAKRDKKSLTETKIESYFKKAPPSVAPTVSVPVFPEPRELTPLLSEPPTLSELPPKDGSLLH